MIELVKKLSEMTLLERLDYRHRTLVLAFGKEISTEYSEAAAEIRRLIELLKVSTTR